MKKTGTVVSVKKCAEPSEEYIDEIMVKVLDSVKNVYEDRPEWENRDLVIN